jgi:Flp pilus assembly protein TadD/4-amino-4-deoxy-L-arabinose transferase-like glycosyltransferase
MSFEMAKKKKILPPKAPPKEIKTGAPKLLWVLLAAALAVKITYLFFSRQSPFYEPLLLDPRYYHDWAAKLLGGQWGDGVFYGLPLYPFFLALVYKLFSGSFLAAKIIQVFLGLVTLFFVYKTAEKIASRRAGLLAVGVGAFYGPLFFYEPILIPETLSLPLYAAGFYLACVLVDAPGLKKAAALGVVLGLAALTKAGVLLFAVLFFAWLLARAIFFEKKSIAPALLGLALFFLTLLPVTAHNLVRGKDTVFLTSHSGLNFYVGNNPEAEGVFMAPEGAGTNVDAQRVDSKAAAEKSLGRELKPSEVSRYWSDKAWEFIRQNPGKFLELCGRKLVLFFDAREISDVEDYVFSKNFNPFLKFPWIDFSILGPLAILGLAAIFKNRAWRFLVYGWVGTYILGVIAFFVNARYRLPLLPIFLVLGAGGALDLYFKVRAKDWKKVLFYFLILAAGVAVSQARLVGADWSRDWVNAGDALQQKKDYEGALSFYQKALEINPSRAKAHLAMGLALSKLGRHDEAKDFYLKTTELDPGNSQGHNNLGMWYDRRGDLTRAEEHFLKAVELGPASFQAHNNLGMVYGKRGENQKAIEEFETALKLNPESPRARTNLGLVLYKMGDKEKAKALWRQALEIDPGFEEARRALGLS